MPNCGFSNRNNKTAGQDYALEGCLKTERTASSPVPLPPYLRDLANKNIRLPVKFHFQTNNKYLSSVVVEKENASPAKKSGRGKIIKVMTIRERGGCPFHLVSPERA